MDELHSIENKGDKVLTIFLTPEQRGVKQTRSLTISEVFPIGGESGTRASSRNPPQAWKSSDSSATAVAEQPGDAVGGRQSAGSAAPAMRLAKAGRSERRAAALLPDTHWRATSERLEAANFEILSRFAARGPADESQWGSSARKPMSVSTGPQAGGNEKPVPSARKAEGQPSRGTGRGSRRRRAGREIPRDCKGQIASYWSRRTGNWKRRDRVPRH